MKKSVFTIALLLGLQFSLSGVADDNTKVGLRVPNFVRPLFEKWVAEYQKTNKDVDFQFVSAKSQDNNNTISLTTDNDAVAFARFAVLPVTAKASKVQELIGSHRFNAKKLKNLFFVKDEYDDEVESDRKEEEVLHVYTGSSQQSVSRFFASYFNQETVNYKGKKIAGDDSFLNVAISRDSLGVTLNPLSNIFDLESRQVRSDLALLPLDINKQGKLILSEGHLDDIITLLESQSYSEIPVGNIGLAYNHANPVLDNFVQWILLYGTQYVHEYGLLQLPKKYLAQK